MTFASGQFGPDTFVDTAGNTLLIGATVTVPGGYTATVDSFGTLIITGPASDAVSVSAATVSNGTIVKSVRVQALAAELDGRFGGDLRNQGAWLSTKNYAKNDVVTRSYGLYAALQTVPAGNDPTAAPGGPTTVGSATAPGTLYTFGSGAAQRFTLSVSTTITDVILTAGNSAMTGGTMSFYNDFAAGSATGPALASAPTVARGVGQTQTVTLAAPLTLAAGTYRLASTDPGTGVVGTPATLSGNISSIGDALYGAGFGSSNTSNFVPFTFLAAYTPTWGKLATLGVDPASALPDAAAAHLQGAWTAAATYVKNDVVTRAYGLFMAPAPIAANVDPATNSVSASNPLGVANDVIPGNGNAYSGFSPGGLMALSVTPTKTTILTSVTFFAQPTNTNSGTSCTVGVASAVGASASGVTILSSAPQTVGGSTWQSFTTAIPAVTLLAGTTYYLFVRIDAANTYAISLQSTVGTSPVDQGSSVPATSYYGTSGSSAYLTNSSGTMPGLLGNGMSVASWSKLANLGDNPANSVANLGALVAGPQVVANNVVKGGVEVPMATTLRRFAVRLDTAPVGASVNVALEQFRAGVSQGVVATLVVAAGTGGVSNAALAVALAQFDVLRVNVTQVGSTTAGSDMAVSIGCYA